MRTRSGPARAGTEPTGARRLSLLRDGWWIAGVSGLTLLGVAALRIELLDWGAVGIMTALGLATGVFAFRIDEDSYASFASAVFAASAALFGAFIAAWVVGITTALLSAITLRASLRQTALDVGTQVVAIFCAGTIYLAIGGRIAPTQVGVIDAARFVALFASFGLLSIALKGLAAGGAEESLKRYARWMTGKGVVIELSMLPLGMLLVVAYTPGEPATFPLLAVVLMISGAAGKTLWDTRRTLAERVDELRALNALGHDLSSTLRLDVLVDLIHGHAESLAGASAVCLSLYESESGKMEHHASFGEGERTLNWSGELGASPASWVVRHRAGLLVDDLAAPREERQLENEMAAELEKRQIEARAWLGVPLNAGRTFIGVLSVLGRAGCVFDDSDLQLFESIGAQVARATENARLYEGLERSRRTIEQWNRTLEERVEARTRELSQARAELQELNDRLEQRVDERTRELHEMQDKIVQSGRLAAVGELAAGVAHELNNPLGGILGYIQYDIEKVRTCAGTGLSPEETRRLDEHLCQMERQAQRCRGIVRNLLRFSRESEDTFTAIDINAAISETIEFTEKQLAVRGIEVVVDLDPSVPRVLGDAHQLQQVFANIILNARNAMPSGGRLLVRSGVGSERPDEVSIAFSDSGKGIREEYLGRVFEPFFTTSEVGQGTGLGLSVGYGIVRDHGGDIDVESEVGIGSTFTIRLPVADQAIADTLPHTSRREMTC
ncbi:MAG: GAF domain-containing protein [Candidatus Eisenbacteria bacterium]|nr:GAF domain-containing protein [Candidatus Eisenbacteria bacterium]